MKAGEQARPVEHWVERRRIELRHRSHLAHQPECLQQRVALELIAARQRRILHHHTEHQVGALLSEAAAVPPPSEWPTTTHGPSTSCSHTPTAPARQAREVKVPGARPDCPCPGKSTRKAEVSAW